MTSSHFTASLLSSFVSSFSSSFSIFVGGYYACNKYLKGVAEGTLEGEAKSAHAAEAANLAWQKEGID